MGNQQEIDRLRKALKALDLPENQAFIRPVYAALDELEREHKAACAVADAALAYRDCPFQDDDKFFRQLVAAVQRWERLKGAATPGRTP
jgi:hypothetical protein